MKSIILAGGYGTRLYPSTSAVSKQLLPIYDKPMIYYPLSVIMLAGIRDVLLISTPADITQYERLLGDGSKWGLCINYCVQSEPRGLAEAFILGEAFLCSDDACLVLGDNVFYGMGISTLLKQAKDSVKAGGGCIFAYPVSDARSYGVVEFNEHGRAVSIEEKPEKPKSNYAIPGLYFYGNTVCSIAREIKPSPRGELEISAVNNVYLQQGNLQVINLGRGTAWLDTGTPQGLLSAAHFVEAVQSRQGLYIACIEEIAFKNDWISTEDLEKIGNSMKTTEYGAVTKLKICTKELLSHRVHGDTEEKITENNLLLCVHSVSPVPLCENGLVCQGFQSRMSITS